MVILTHQNLRLGKCWKLLWVTLSENSFWSVMFVFLSQTAEKRQGNIQLINNAKVFWHIAIEIMMSWQIVTITCQNSVSITSCRNHIFLNWGWDRVGCYLKADSSTISVRMYSSELKAAHVKTKTLSGTRVSALQLFTVFERTLHLRLD